MFSSRRPFSPHSCISVVSRKGRLNSRLVSRSFRFLAAGKEPLAGSRVRQRREPGGSWVRGPCVLRHLKSQHAGARMAPSPKQMRLLGEQNALPGGDRQNLSPFSSAPCQRGRQGLLLLSSAPPGDQSPEADHLPENVQLNRSPKCFLSAKSKPAHRGREHEKSEAISQTPSGI